MNAGIKKAQNYWHTNEEYCGQGKILKSSRYNSNNSLLAQILPLLDSHQKKMRLSIQACLATPLLSNW